MATKRKFKQHERYGLWAAYNSTCFWGAEVVPFEQVTVDHVLPEELEGRPDELARLVAMYSLPDSFKINDYCNWVPCCIKHNQQKGTRTFDMSPALIFTLDRVREFGEKARAEAEKLLRQAKASKTRASIATSIEAGHLSPEDLLAIHAEYADAPAVGSGWRTIGAGENATRVVRVSGGAHAIGIAPRQNSSEWECPHCHSYGPWNGVICLNCGRRSTDLD